MTAAPAPATGLEVLRKHWAHTYHSPRYHVRCRLCGREFVLSEYRVVRAVAKTCDGVFAGDTCGRSVCYSEHVRWSGGAHGPGISFFYYCPRHWRTVGPDGFTPEQRAMMPLLLVPARRFRRAKKPTQKRSRT